MLDSRLHGNDTGNTNIPTKNIYSTFNLGAKHYFVRDFAGGRLVNRVGRPARLSKSLPRLYACSYRVTLSDFYRANSTDRDSLITLTFISPGYLSSFSIRIAISRAIFFASRSETWLGNTNTRISRPA